MFLFSFFCLKNEKKTRKKRGKNSEKKSKMQVINRLETQCILDFLKKEGFYLLFFTKKPTKNQPKTLRQTHPKTTKKHGTNYGNKI